MLKLAYQYMKYYKSQTFAILASIVLTAALLSGVSSLMYSSQRNQLENNKFTYGNWHYYMEAEEDALKSVDSAQQGAGFFVEQCGRIKIRDIISEPYEISFVEADEEFLEMAHREVVEGRYPSGAGEIAADRYTLGNLGFSGNVGETLFLDGKEYTLTGIVKSAWAAGSDEMAVFVGEEFEGRGSRPFLYLRFGESEKLYRQLDAFCRKYGISQDTVQANDEVTMYLDGEKPDSIYDIVKFALTDEKGNLTYLVLKLQTEYDMAFNGMIVLLCVFSLFIIYSIFQISVSRRTTEYGMLQTLGISGGRIGGTLILELWMLFFTGYPIGCLLGNGVLHLFYREIGNVFLTRNTGTGQNVLSGADQIVGWDSGRGPDFYVAFGPMLAGFIFLFAAMAFVGWLTVHSMQKQSICQAMNGDTSYTRGRRRIYSKRNRNLANVVVGKFMFSNKKRVAGILLSLSVGGCIFLCAAYMAENLKIHMEMSMKSDDGLGSEYRVSIKSDALSDTIPEAVMDAIRDMPELGQVCGTKYVLGELTVQESDIKWKEYFDERNKDSLFCRRYGGICVDKGDGTYGIKYDIYGYDEEMLEMLDEFILEGEIDIEKFRSQDQVIAVANRDGQGNYDFYGKHPGDTVVLQVPKELNCPEEVLKFQSPQEYYTVKEFKIAAIVSRALAREDSFLNVGPWDNAQSIIMPNRQMDRVYGIRDYSFVNASGAEAGNRDQTAGELLKKIQDVPKAVLKDYTSAIEVRKAYLRQQQMFFSGIGVILLVISLFHIMNSMNYSILSRRREYGIIRAVGITEAGFYRMILRTGLLYGGLADVLIFLIYQGILRRVMDYYMAHVVQFLHFTAGVPKEITGGVMILNILIAVTAVIIPAKKIGSADIISQI